MAPAFMKMGYQDPILLIAIAIGLFTRLFAAMLTIEMAVIMFAHYLPNGFSWLTAATSSSCCGGWSRSPSGGAAAGRTRSTA